MATPELSDEVQEDQMFSRFRRMLEDKSDRPMSSMSRKGLGDAEEEESNEDLYQRILQKRNDLQSVSP